MADPYDSDVSDPYTPPPVVIGAAQPPVVDTEAAKGYLRNYTDKAAGHAASYEDIMRRRKEAVEQIRSQLDGTIEEMRAAKSGAGRGQVNLPLLALGAGLLQGSPPGTAGNFGQDLGRGAAGMGAAIARQRMTDADFLRGIADLQTRSGQMGDIPLRDEAANEQRKEIQAETNKSRLEVALTRAQATGANGSRTPADERKFQLWRASPGNENKSYEEYGKWVAANSARTPSEERMFEIFKQTPGNENVSLEEFKRRMASAGASGKETGKSTAEAAAALPSKELSIDNVVDTVKKVYEHPGLDKAVGVRSYLPSIRGGAAANFEKQLEVLKSQTFLAEVEKMRGLGALTEPEGKKVAQAIGSLELEQDPTQFREQLKSILDLMEKGRMVARQKATGIAPTPGARLAPDGKWYLQKDGKYYPVEQ